MIGINSDIGEGEKGVLTQSELVQSDHFDATLSLICARADGWLHTVLRTV